MIQLEVDTAHINNGFGAQNVGVMMGVPGVQYSGSYGGDLYVTISTCAPLIYNYIYVAL